MGAVESLAALAEEAALAEAAGRLEGQKGLRPVWALAWGWG